MSRHSNQLQSEFLLFREVLPIMLVGILLNMGGRFAAENLKLSYLFLDQVGTVMMAILCGPWWAASVGILSNTINGNVFETYFPFGVVVIAAVIIGYYARLAELRPKLIEATTLDWYFLIKSLLVVIFLLALGSAHVSLLIKTQLYPLAERPFLYGKFYVGLVPKIKALLGDWQSDLLMLWLIDMLREFIDKSIVAILAFAFAIGYGFEPVALRLGKPLERLYTDTLSMLVFSVSYSFYLVMAKIFVPKINFPGARHSIDWLQHPGMIAMFYSPLILCLLAFFLLSLNGNSALGRQYAAALCERDTRYSRKAAAIPDSYEMLEKTPLFKLVEKKSVYGLLVGVASWPFGKNLQLPLLLGLYFAFAIAFLAVFFKGNRDRRARMLEMRKRCRQLHDWLAIGTRQSGQLIVDLFMELFKAKNYKLTTSAGPIADMRCVYVTLPFSPLFSKESDRRKSAVTQGDALLVCLEGERILTAEIFSALFEQLLQIGLQQLIIVSLTPVIYDPNITRNILTARSNGIRITLVSWFDLEIALYARAYEKSVLEVLEAAQTRTYSIAIQNLMADAEHLTATDLAARSLPALAYLLEKPGGSIKMVDIGAGRGRHSLFALRLGYTVSAIECKDKTFNDLRNYVAEAGYEERCSTVLADFMSLDVGIEDQADMVVCTGMLQHAKHEKELYLNLQRLRDYANVPAGLVFIEMLFEMKFDGKPPADGRIAILPEQFESLLQEVFTTGEWEIWRVQGPLYRRQEFGASPRSFLPPAKVIESTAIEYAIFRNS